MNLIRPRKHVNIWIVLYTSIFFLSLTPLYASADTDYLVGANDILQIEVYGYPELKSQIRVSDSGNISFPLIGEISIVGLSSHNIESTIETRLKHGNYIKQPHVSVMIDKFKSQLVSVMGNVLKPGQFPLEKPSTVIDLLAAAGGVDREKSGNDIVLLHKSGNKQKIDMEALFQGDPQQNLAVKDGDTIYVPKADQFYIYGEVQRPGVYRLERRMTVSQAIATGGGLTPRGTERKPSIKRLNFDGSENSFVVESADQLLPNDTLYIRESWF